MPLLGMSLMRAACEEYVPGLIPVPGAGLMLASGPIRRSRDIEFLLG